MWETTKASGVVALASTLPVPTCVQVSSSSARPAPTSGIVPQKNPFPTPTVTNPSRSGIHASRSVTDPPINVKDPTINVTRTEPKSPIRAGGPPNVLSSAAQTRTQVPIPSLLSQEEKWKHTLRPVCPDLGFAQQSVKQICSKSFISSHLRLRSMIPKRSIISYGCNAETDLPCRQDAAKREKKRAKYVP